MTSLINNYIVGNVETYQAIFRQGDLKETNFEDAIMNKISKYIGKTEHYLAELFGVNGKSKHSNNLIIMRMLGVNTDNAEEFKKANIQIKTIRVNKEGMPREHMSFPNFKILDFIKEDFDDSDVYSLFSETNFLFIVFQEDLSGNYVLKGSKFWNMAITELETTGQKEWYLFQNKFKQGINFNINGSRVDNDLPTAKDTDIFHVRLHATNTAYVINGVKYGKGTDSDMDTLPNGDKMTKQCFWLNK